MKQLRRDAAVYIGCSLMYVYLHRQHKNITSDLYIQMCLGEAVQK